MWGDGCIKHNVLLFVNNKFDKANNVVFNLIMSAIQKAIELSGGVSALAEKLKVRTPQVVSNWRSRDNVPAEYCLAIESITNGQVTREQLRPDVFGPTPTVERTA